MFRLRARLVLIALIAVIPALAVIVYTQTLERGRARDRTLENNLRFTHLAASQQAAIFEETRRLLLTLAEFAAVRANDPTACYDLLPKLQQEHPGYNSLAVVSRNGTRFCSSLGTSPLVVRDRSWFQRALRTRAMVVGDYQVSRTTGKPDIVVAHPLLTPSGEVDRIIIASVELDRLSRIVSLLSLPRGATITLFDRNRTILARYPDAAEWVGKLIPNSVPLDSIGKERIEDAVGVDGVRRLYVTVPVETTLDTGLYVGMGIERSAAFAEADRILRQQLWLLALVSLATVVAAGVGGEAFLLRPLKALRAVTSRLAAGDLSARAELAGGVPGLSELANAVNSMAVTLEARQRERDQAEQQLRASEEHYRVPFEHAPHPSWVTDVETLRFIEINRAACEHYGYSRDEFLQMKITDIRPPEDVPKVIDFIDRLMNHSTTGAPADWIHRKKDGTLITVEISSMLVTMGGRQVLIVLAHDISERRQLEQQLQQSQKMEAVGRLAGGIAHDFNNLLTVILGNAELVLEQLELDQLDQPGSASSVRAVVDQMRQAAESAASLTRQLLAFSRKQVLQPQIVDLNRVVARIHSLLQRVIGEDLQMVTRLAPSLDRVSADPGQLEQVLLNLAVNARDAMPSGGTLTIATMNIKLDEEFAGRYPGASAGHFVCISVQDTGTGIDELTMPHLFEPFFTTKERGKGTGLGLATVYGIVKQSGGFIRVDTQPGRGTTFSISLPRATQPVDEVLVAPARPSSSRGTETILVVEDQPAVRAVTKRILASHGYTVLEAAGGADALALVREHQGTIDLLLTDVVMPSMNGHNLAIEVRARLPGIRVLYSSGYTDEAIVDQSGLNRTLAFIQKPFTPPILLHKVREVLDAQ